MKHNWRTCLGTHNVAALQRNWLRFLKAFIIKNIQEAVGLSVLLGGDILRYKQYLSLNGSLNNGKNNINYKGFFNHWV